MVNREQRDFAGRLLQKFFACEITNEEWMEKAGSIGEFDVWPFIRKEDLRQTRAYEGAIDGERSG